MANQEQMERMLHGRGFIAALDQSGGSTPKALSLYGIPEGSYSGQAEMSELVQEMRARIICSPAFNRDRILAAILFENTMRLAVNGEPTADYLWKRKGIVPFLKVDQGLAEFRNGVRLMKPLPNLGLLLREAVEKNIFGTKMRSFIQEADEAGITETVAQQFDYAAQICASKLVPILEPEIDLKAPDRAEAEEILKRQIWRGLKALPARDKVIFKVTIPVEADFYRDLLADPRVLRVVALSGGHSRREACRLLAANHGLVASFSRALTEGLARDQSEPEFNAALDASVQEIYQASIT